MNRRSHSSRMRGRAVVLRTSNARDRACLFSLVYWILRICAVPPPHAGSRWKMEATGGSIVDSVANMANAILGAGE
jgi:hypothetical protein